jgi:transcriptional regulator with XRE-family HTH domain
MGKPNLGRTVATNKALAQRIAYERERKGWTMQELAERMDKVGCRIHHTAVYKIERGNPQRTVSFEEAVAFAKVFGLDLDELSLPPTLARNAEARRHVDALFTALHDGAEAAERERRAREALAQLLLGDAELIEDVHTILEPTRLDADAFMLQLGVTRLDENDNIVMTEKESPSGKRRKKA